MTRILVVDDDLENREIVKLRLEQAGFEVQEAGNGEEGVNAAQENPPNIIVLDVMMPKLDGWQVCRVLKSDFRTKKIPIIMLTARNQQIEELRGWESGADDYLTKPCDYKVLLEKIDGFLSRTKDNLS
jgi:DNA-binding response OmpR family regulator